MKAMILAAGRGERMRPLSGTTPKPLLRVGGKPLIEWTLQRLRGGGIGEIVVNHAHLGGQIEAALGDGSRFGLSIQYSPETEALETGGGVAKALPMLAPGAFIATAGDIYCEYDFSRLNPRLVQGRLAHLVLVPNPPHNPDGDFGLDDDDLLKNNGPERYTFSGIGVYDPQLFAGITPGSRHKLAPLLRQAADSGQASGEIFTGAWFDIGTPERLASLDRELSRPHFHQAVRD